jgi:hypothetical protein
VNALGVVKLITNRKNPKGPMIIDTAGVTRHMNTEYENLSEAEKQVWIQKANLFNIEHGIASKRTADLSAVVDSIVAVVDAKDSVDAGASVSAGTGGHPAKKARPHAALGATPTANSVAGAGGGAGGMTAFFGQVAHNMSDMLGSVGIYIPVPPSKADGKAPAPEQPSDDIMRMIVDAINALFDTEIATFMMVVSVYGAALTSDTTKLADAIVSNFMRRMMNVPAGQGWTIHFQYNDQQKQLVLSDSDRAYLATKQELLLLTAKDKVEDAFKNPEPLPKETVCAFHKALMGKKFITSP